MATKIPSLRTTTGNIGTEKAVSVTLDRGRVALDVNNGGDTSAFGETVVTSPDPRVQIDAVYGTLSTDVETLSAGGGSATASASLFSCAIGTGIGDYAVIRSRRTVRYRPGQGIRARFSFLANSVAVANAVQAGGLFTATDALLVGQNSSGAYGVWRRIAGAAAIHRLTITVGAGGVENMTVTLNGVAFVIASGGALSTSATAERIAEVGTFTGWTSVVSPTSNGATVTFIQATPAATAGAFTFSSTGTAAGTFATIQAGAANDDTTAFVAQTAWNVDKCDGTGESGFTLNWAKLNVFEILHSYLGAGVTVFRVLLPSGRFQTIHRIEYPNSATIPNQRNPSYRIGWICASLGSTTALTVKGASAAAFIEGQANPSTRDPFGYDVVVSAGATEYVALALRNRGEFASAINQRVVYPADMTVGVAASNRAVRARVYISPTMTGVVNWQYVDQSLSCMEYATPTTITPSGGRLVATAIASSGSTVLDLHNLDLRIEPGDTVVISIYSPSGTAADTIVGINWQEL